MQDLSKTLAPLVALLLALTLCVPQASAQGRPAPPDIRRANGPARAGAVRPGVQPAVARGGGLSLTLTQNVSQTINAEATGVACPAPPNSYYRVFDLAQFGLGADGIAVTSVGIGIERIGTPSTTTINLYRLSDGPFIQANLELVGSKTADVTAADNVSILEVAVAGQFERTDRLVVEWAVPDGGENEAGNYFGGNTAGQFAPTYLRAETCGVLEPTSLGAIGLPNQSWVVNVTGTTTPFAGPSLRAFPTPVAFGIVDSGTTSAPRTVELTNNGTAAVVITSVTGSGAPFAVSTAGTDLTLDPGQSTTFAVTFAPIAAGTTTGSVAVESNAAGSPLVVALTGAAPPDNDDIAGAFVIDADVVHTASNVGASREPGEGNPGCVNPGAEDASVWWVYTPPSDGLLTVDTFGSAVNTVLSVLREDQTEIACSFQFYFPGENTSRLEEVRIEGGEPVFIRISSVPTGGTGGDPTGDIRFTASFAADSAPRVVSALPPGDTTDQPTFFRPNGVGDGTSGSCFVLDNPTPYQARTFTVSTLGLYTATVTAGDVIGHRLVVYLYEGDTFAPADPCVGLRFERDDYDSPGPDYISEQQMAAQRLEPGVSYTLVVSGDASGGPYTGTIVGPGDVAFAVAGESGPDGDRSALTATPNPTRGDARVRLDVADTQDVTVSVYDVTGRRVATLFDGAVAAGGSLDLTLDGSSLPAGVYVVRAVGLTVDLARRVTVVR